MIESESLEQINMDLCGDAGVTEQDDGQLGSSVVCPRKATETNRTFLALLGLGLGSATANTLVSRGLTVAQLKQMSAEELRARGLDGTEAKSILDAGRPPIPSETDRKSVV